MTTSTHETEISADPKVPLVRITRDFDAPREKVFRAHVDPELLVQWLGPRRLTMRLDRLEARDGGRWRFVHLDTDGNEYGFRGVFHGQPSVEGIIQTWEYEGNPGAVSLETVTFTESGGVTTVTVLMDFGSKQSRDAAVATGMTDGMEQSYQLLEGVLGTMPSQPEARL